MSMSSLINDEGVVPCEVSMMCVFLVLCMEGRGAVCGHGINDLNS